MEENNQNQNQPVQSQPAPAPMYQQPYEDNTPLTIGNYLVMMIVGAIPLVGLIMMLVWAFSGNSNANRKNYARAMLILMAIGIVLSIIFGASIGALIASMAGAAH